MATAVRELERYCGAKLGKRPGVCRLKAGWGTEHPGVGPCRMHGGMLPNVVRKLARQEGQKMAIQWGIEADVDPFEGILQSVRMAYGAVAAFKSKIPQDAGPDHVAVIAWMASQKQAATIAKLAIDAGIAERQVQLAERMGEMIAMAHEDALADEDLPPEVVARIAQRFSAGLLKLEAGGTIEGSESA